MTSRPGDREPLPAVAAVMAGGRGTRFWPVSRRRRPKQLLPLGGDTPLLRATWERVAPLFAPERTLVITGAALADACRELLPELPPEAVIGEPVGRNTAPCAALAAGIAAREHGPATPLVLLPADHLIGAPDVFRDQLAEACALATAGAPVVTFGVVPDRPATGYGYNETTGEGPVRRGVRFVEKPDAATAAAWLRGGRHLWNSGLFVWRCGALLERLREHAPAVVEALAPAVAAYGTPDFPRRLAAAYAACPSVSIDYAVMEHLADFPVLPARFPWSDLGGWESWAATAPDLGDGNRGAGDVFLVDSRDNIVHAGGRTVALLGARDLVGVATDDAVLVCPRDRAEAIRDLIARLEAAGREDLL